MKPALRRRLARGAAVLVPVLLHALAREADLALGLVLRAELEPAGLLREVARALGAQGPAGLARVAGLGAVGALVVLLLAGSRARRERTTPGAAFEREATLFLPLLLRPALSLLALVSVGLRPSFPYAFTLPVALTQDWGLAQDAATLATLLALRAPLPRLPPPRAREVFLIGALAYALLTPGWARVWEGHPGNEPKYLRQAVALGHELSFDAEGVSAAMEELPIRPLGETLGRAAGTLADGSVRMLAAVARGEAGRGAIQARRITRQTIRGWDGGVYYVLAPGPSLLLAPTLRIDRALNRAHRTPGRLAVTLLAWNALAALAVAVLFRLVRDATGRPGLAAALAFGFALVPPLVFYSFQFYPELPAALVLGVAFGVLALRPATLVAHAWRLGLLLSTLPWLHQKFLPVWLVLTATAFVVARRETRDRGRLLRVAVAIALPQLLSLYLTALYNFVITGSVRPDALFLAWGPAGVGSARVGQGVLGLLLDARYGLLPYVPVFALAAAGLARGGGRRFAVVIPAALSYYVTVASADNWAGAVCNLGRYLLPLVPLAAALVGIAIAGPARADGTAEPDAERPLRRGGAALVLALAAWSAIVAAALWNDPVAANDSALLLAKSTYADASRYIPGLFIRHWSDAAPGLWARIGAWLVAIVLLSASLRRVRSPSRALAGLALTLLALACVLERWPSPRSAPSFGDALRAGPGELVFLEGPAEVGEDQAVLGPGRFTLVRRSRPDAAANPGAALRATFGGSGVLRIEGLAPIVLRPSGGVVELPLLAYHVVAGSDGGVAVFSRLRASLAGEAVMRFDAQQATPDPRP